MASRRELKKKVNYIMGDLFAECLVQKEFIPGTDKEKAEQLLTQILEAHEDFISRISHTEAANVKGFYRKYRKDFQAKVDEIIGAIEKLN